MRTLTPRLTALTVVLSLLTAPIIALTAAAPAHASSTKDQEYENTNHKLTGEARKKVGLRPLIRDKEIDKVAKNWSKNMAEKQTMSHNPNFHKQIREGWHFAAENVVYMCHAPGDLGARAHNLWMNSKGHRENILRQELTRIGIGFYTDKKGCTWATQVFAGYVTDPNPKLPITKKASTITGFSTSKTTKPSKKITWKGVKVSNTAVLQRYDNKKWKTVRTLKKGTHNITLKAANKNKAVKRYRIVVKETATTTRKTSPTVSLTAKLTVTKKKSTITGFSTSKTVKPSKKATWKKVKVSSTAVLQRYDNKKWKTVRTLKKGTHNITLKAAKKNKAVKSYRIVVKETATTTRKTSPTVRLTARK